MKIVIALITGLFWCIAMCLRLAVWLSFNFALFICRIAYGEPTMRKLSQIMHSIVNEEVDNPR